MKLMLLLTVVLGIQIKASVYSQATFLSLNVKDTPIREVLNKLENSSKFKFFYNEDFINVDVPVSIKVSNTGVDKILEEILTGTNIDFRILENNMIVLTKRQDNQQNQQAIIKGKVTDMQGNPLPGVNIVEKGTTNGAVTNLEGEYSISVGSLDAILSFSYVGFLTEEFEINGQTSIDVILIEDIQSLEEVVVVGYGFQKKATLTGAVSAIDGDNVLTTKNSSIAQSIQGKIAGVLVKQNDGQPGAFGSTINIRGLGQPVYVIDGVMRDSGDGAEEFQRINPEDIESISVLKDGSAAIYGMKGANGAIIVTTKRGQKGKPVFKYNGTLTAVSPTSMLEVMNAAQYMEIMNDYSMNNGTGPFTTEEEIEKWREGGPGYESTDWLGSAFKKLAFSTHHNFSVEGGTDAVTYYASLGYTEDGDLTKGGDFNYKRYSFRNNLTAKLSDHLSAEVNISGRYDVTNAPIASIFDIMFQSTIMNPTSSIYANNNPEYFNYASPMNDNPIARMDGSLTGMNIDRKRSFQSTVSLKYDLPWIKGLYAKVMASFDANDGRVTHERKEFKLYTYDDINDIYNYRSLQSPSSLYVAMSNANRLNVQSQLSYSTSINDEHNISLMGLFESLKEWSDGGSMTREYQVYVKPVIDFGDESNLKNSGSYSESANLSYLGKMNYDFRGKYLLEAAFRYNGTYGYVNDKKWVFLPLISAGWRLSEEPFIKEALPFLSNFKLRASYGLSGYDSGARYQYLNAFQFTSDGFVYEFEDGVGTNGINTPGLTNKNLTWTKSKMYDVGFDAMLGNGLLEVTFDVYKRDMTGIPATPTAEITNTFGASIPQENLDATQTTGIEFSLGHQNKINDFTYGVQGNFNFARTKDIIVTQSEYTSSWDKWHRRGVDRWQGVGWGYETLGQFTDFDQIYNAPVQTSGQGNTLVYPGDYYLKDTNGDGYIDSNDELPMFYSVGIPAVNYGINMNAMWKNFDFNMLFQGTMLYSLQIPDNLRNYAPWDGNSSAYLYDRWHRADPFDPNSEWIPGKNPAPRNANYMPSGNNAANSDRNTVNGSYLRLKSMELGYTFNKIVMDHIGFDQIRIYVNAYNIYTFYDKFLKNDVKVDPEKSTGQDNRMMNYPLSSTISIGLNANF